MCGICGVWEYGAAQGNVERALVTAMRDVMTHRGPDDAGELIFDDARGGFGFRRLSIIDLSEAGHQPMRGCTDRVWLVFNGAITSTHHGPIRKPSCIFTKSAVWILFLTSRVITRLRSGTPIANNSCWC